jgi:hypothetical protein
MRRSFGHLWAPSMRLMVAAFLLALGSSQSPAQGIGGACSQEGQKCYLPYSCASGQPPTSGVGCAMLECQRGQSVGRLEPSGDCTQGTDCNYATCGSDCYQDQARCYHPCNLGERCQVDVCRLEERFAWDRSPTVCNEGLDCGGYSPCN